MTDYGLTGKKLLFLGGIQRACKIVERAQELGVYVVVADYNEDSPAKKVADEGVLLDATDVDARTQYCIENHVDGITTAYADILLTPCMEVSRRIGRPFYADETMIRISTDKAAFKACMREHGLPIPKTYEVTTENYRQRAQELTYPVFLKPVDASGSRGADVCRSPEDFCRKFEYALTFSRKKQITVEDFLEGTEFILDYLLIDGEAYLLSMADRYSSAGRGPAVNSPNLMLLPSKNLEQYVRQVDPKVGAMAKALGLQNGVLFFQGYANGDRITFYEMGCRLGGTWPYVDEHFTGYNPIDMLVSHALTGRMLPPEVDRSRISPFFSGRSAIIYYLANRPEGEIRTITGMQLLEQMPEVVCVLQNYREGDRFSLGRFTDVRFLAIHLVAPDDERLNRVVERIYSEIDYLGADGSSLLYRVIHMADIPGLHIGSLPREGDTK